VDIVIREKEKSYPDLSALLVNDLWDNKLLDENVISVFNKVKGN